MSRISAAAGVYGEDAIAAMGIVLRIVTLGVNVVFGHMKGFQPMAGSITEQKLFSLKRSYPELYEVDYHFLCRMDDIDFPTGYAYSLPVWR